MDGYLDDSGSPRLVIHVAGATASLAALIDTGFDGELLTYVGPLDAIGVRPVYNDVASFRLADGNEATFFVTTLRITWHDTARDANVHIVPAAAPPGVSALIGCRLLRDSRLEIDFPRGTVRVARDA